MNIEHWKQFESTGRIEDYLSFLSCERQEEAEKERDSGSVPGEAGEDRGSRNRTGNDSHAGIYMGQGNCTKAGSCGGVRQTYQSFDMGVR